MELPYITDEDCSLAKASRYLKKLFKGDHVTAGIVLSYFTVTRYAEAATTGHSFQEEIRPTTSWPTWNAPQPPPAETMSHIATVCPNQEILAVLAVWFFASIFYLVMQWRSLKTASKTDDDSTASAEEVSGNYKDVKRVLGHTLLFSLYLLTLTTQPLLCRAKEAKKVQLAAASIQLIVLTLPLLLAHHPIKKRTPRMPKEEPSTGTLYRKLWKLDHSDLFLFHIYQIVVGFAHPIDPTQCNKEGKGVTWAAFGLCVILFNLKHFFILHHDSKRCCHTKISAAERSWQRVVFYLCRTVLFAVLLIVSNPYPLSCNMTTTAKIRNLSFTHSGLSFLMTIGATMASLWQHTKT